MLSWVTHALSPRAVPTATAGAHWEADAFGSVRTPSYRAPVLRLEDELRRVRVRRDPPVEVIIPGRWTTRSGPVSCMAARATSPTIAAFGFGLTYRRKHAPGFSTGVVSWASAEELPQR